MRRLTAELAAGLLTSALATAAFIAWRVEGERWAGTLPGHTLGVVGIMLMLWAGFAYSWRKRQLTPGAQPMRSAMQTHIVAGLVGPFLVILHSGFAFRGLAGVLSFMMVLVVASGVIGRALMSAIPATIALSDPVRSALLDAELARLETSEAQHAREHPGDRDGLEAWRQRIVSVRHAQELQRSQWTQSGSGNSARRLVSAWWFLHVPVSVALWVVAVAHIIASVYFVSLSR